MPRPLFIPGKDLVPIVQEAVWAPGQVWTGAENLAPSGFDPRTVQPVDSGGMWPGLNGEVPDSVTEGIRNDVELLSCAESY
jgi:hypothetical protein